jgi:hypothetical protein
MSLYIWDPKRPNPDPPYPRQSTRCFYCGDNLFCHDAIRWMGRLEVEGDDLWLHPSCVLRLMTRLMRDVHEYECIRHVGATLSVDAGI